MFDNIRTKIRAILNENSKTTRDISTFKNSRAFLLSEDNVIGITAVNKNDDDVSESGNWSYASDTNKLTFEDDYSLTSSDVIEIIYTYYPNYSNNELDGFIRASMSYLSVHHYKTFEINDDDINPEPVESEENIMAVVASIIIRPDNKSYRLPDMTVTVPIAAMPTDDMIRKVIASFKKNSHGVFSVININEC